MSSPLSTVPPWEQQRKPQDQQQDQTQHARPTERESGGKEEEEGRPDLQSIIASASHSQLSHILLDLCRHSKTATDLTRTYLSHQAAVVPVPVPVALSVSSTASPRDSNEASQKKPKVLRSILKKRKEDYPVSSPSREPSQSSPRPDHSRSIARVSLALPHSVAGSPAIITTTNTTSSNKDMTNPSHENDSHSSKKRKGPASSPTRCRNCGSEYTTTPHSSPSRTGRPTKKEKEEEEEEEEEEVCIHHPGEREVQPTHAVWDDFDPDMHGDAWTLMEYEAFACGFRWSCCKREVGDVGCVVAGRHEAAPVPLAMPMWKRGRR